MAKAETRICLFSFCCDEEALRGLREVDPDQDQDPDPDQDQSGTTEPGPDEDEDKDGGQRAGTPDRDVSIRDVSDRKWCSACRCSFSSREEQTEHYKLDWHRFNLRRKMAAVPPLSAEEFEKKTGAGDVSSISGSESNSESDSEEETSGNNLNGTDESPARTAVSDRRRSCKLLLQNATGHFLSLFRCIVQGKTGVDQDVVSSLRTISPRTLWVILMTGGGHFAGAVFQGKNVLQHKTFHRYTVRAKRGTAQGLRDAQNRNHAPKSAGAALRRHNEAALAKEIQDLLETWSGHLEEASLVFIRAPSYNRNVFFSGRSPLHGGDARIRSLPFNTRRATFRELQQVHDRLSTVLVYGNLGDVAAACRSRKERRRREEPEPSTASETQTQNEDQLSSEEEAEVQLVMVEETIGTLDLREEEVQPSGSRRRRRRRKMKRRKETQQETGESNTEEEEEEEEEAPPAEQTCQSKNRRRSKAQSQKHLEGEDLPDGWCDYSVRDALFTACKVGDVAALRQLLLLPAEAPPPPLLPAETQEASGGVAYEAPPPPLNEPIDSAGFTLLHVASAAAQTAAVRLLLDAGADPASRDKRGQTPYVVAPDKHTRNVFRKFMGENPEKYDYSRAQIPAPLTAENESKKTEKKKAQKALKKQREKEQKEEKRRQQEEEEEKRRFTSLSDREKRALAAERRLQQQQVNVLRCWTCGESLQSKVPFNYSDFSFCSTTCLQEHRRSAAGRR